MKIEHRLQPSAKVKLDRQKNIETSDTNNSFSDFLQQEKRKDSKEFLAKLLQDIDEQGEKFVQFRNVKELKKYKELIKTFMDEAVKASLQLEERVSYDRLGRSKRLKIIRDIDKKLLELTDMILHNESNQIEFLNRIGEIKGLLINIYF